MNQLHDAVDSFKQAEDPPLEAVTAKRTARSVSSIKLRIDSSRKLIKSKIDLVRDAEKEEGVLLSLPKVKMSLRSLEKISMRSVNRSLKRTSIKETSIL